MQRVLGSWLLFLVACSSVTEGAALDVTLAQVAANPTQQADDGRAVTLSRAMLAVGSVDLVGCNVATEPQAGDVRLATLTPLHSESSPTTLGEPAAWDLLGQSAAKLGTLQPPPGQYCALTVHLLPVDSDALGVQVGDVGKTLVLEGSAGDTAFALSVDSVRDVPIALAAPVTFTAEDQLGVELSVSTQDWLRGVTFAAGHERDDAQRILESLSQRVSASQPR